MTAAQPGPTPDAPDTLHDFCCGEGEQFVQQAEALLWEHVDTDNDAAADSAASMLTALLPAVLAYGDARAAAALAVLRDDATTALARVDGSSYIRLDEGTVWPDPTDPNEVQSRLRFGTPDKRDFLVAASCMSAYRELVTQTTRRRTQVCRALNARLRNALVGQR